MSGVESRESLEYVVQKHSPVHYARLLSEAALIVGSQLPTRQQEWERHHALAPGTAFKANIVLSFLEIGVLAALYTFGDELSHALPVDDPMRPYLDLVVAAGVGFSGIQGTGSAVSAAARTSIYFATGKVSQSFWGVRALIAFADKGMRSAGFDVIAGAKQARTCVYDIAEASKYTRWLNTRALLSSHAPRPEAPENPFIIPRGFVTRYFLASS